MMRLLRLFVPQAVRGRLRLVRDSVRRPHLRRRSVRLPVARLALALAVIRLRRRRAGGRRVGVDRLQQILVINLERRPERLAGFMTEMDRLGIDNATRFDAIADQSGIRGCTLSHAAVMERMTERGWDCIMVCEDDARFAVNREQLDVLIEAFLADASAEIACLAYWHREVERHSSLYLRTTKSFTTACYLVKSSIAADLQTVWEEAAQRLLNGGDREVYGLDHIWNGLQRQRVFLIPIVRAVRQEAGYSDIWEEYVQTEF
jgi:hypothetical protein